MSIYQPGTSLSNMSFEIGDEFAVVGNANISSVIRYVTKGLASHAGVITDKFGNTIESLNRIKRAHISNYIGQRIIIVRPQLVTCEYNEECIINPISLEIREAAIKEIEDKWLSKPYPWWRFIPHMIDSVLPTFGKINLLGIPVCSELVAYNEWKVGIRDGDKIWGVNPDDLADAWLFGGLKYKFVYRGELKK